MKRLYAVLLCALLLSGCTPSMNTISARVMCVRAENTVGAGELVMETRKLPELTGVELYEQLVSELAKTPLGEGLSAAMPSGVRTQSVTEAGGIVSCVFTDKLAEVSDTVRSRTLCAVTGTLCAADGVKGVLVYAGETPLTSEPLTPADWISDTESLRVVTYALTLYFPNLTQDGLTTAVCEVDLRADDEPALAVVETLLSGPVTDAGYIIRFIPDGTRINRVSVENEICTLDLSAEFLSKNIAAPDGTSLTVYALVNSLAALPHVTQVRFLIDGESVESYIHPHFDQPIAPRTSGTIVG